MATACDSRTCKVKFTIIERKHHCRMCRGIFCQACSSRYIPLHTHYLPKAFSFLPGETLSMDKFPGSLVNSRRLKQCHFSWYQWRFPILYAILPGDTFNLFPKKKYRLITRTSSQD
ncbi:hypothetical protein OPQ81_002285 [Rhizoctonia solani]|nr:hypothetical protein OPQ81_002285 [Rhizoctonia solani]